MLTTRTRVRKTDRGNSVDRAQINSSCGIRVSAFTRTAYQNSLGVIKNSFIIHFEDSTNWFMPSLSTIRWPHAACRPQKEAQSFNWGSCHTANPQSDNRYRLLHRFAKLRSRPGKKTGDHSYCVLNTQRMVQHGEIMAHVTWKLQEQWVPWRCE